MLFAVGEGTAQILRDLGGQDTGGEERKDGQTDGAVSYIRDNLKHKYIKRVTSAMRDSISGESN